MEQKTIQFQDIDVCYASHYVRAFLESELNHYYTEFFKGDRLCKLTAKLKNSQFKKQRHENKQ